MAIQGGAGRPYTRANAHQKHLHLSVNWQFRDEAQPWALAPKEQKGYDPLEAIKYFESLGWHKLASVALVANLMWESGGNSKPIPTIIFNAHGDRDKAGVYRSHGAGQWNEKAGRYEALLNFARERQMAWDDPHTQLSFLDHELHTSERRAGIALRAASTLEEAVAASILVWRPSIPHADRRLAIARKLLG